MIYNAFKLIFFLGSLIVTSLEYHGDVTPLKRFVEHQAVPMVISGFFSKMLSRDLRMVKRFFGT